MPEKRITSRRSSARSSKKSSITSLSGKRSSVASTLEKKFLPPPRAVLDQEIQEVSLKETKGSSTNRDDDRSRTVLLRKLKGLRAQKLFSME